MMFEDRALNIFAYNLETILAEKLETVISRGNQNTRPRDYYDIFILYSLKGNKLHPAWLLQAIKKHLKNATLPKSCLNTETSCFKFNQAMSCYPIGKNISGITNMLKVLILQHCAKRL